MGGSSDLTSEQQMVIKALSTAGKTQGEILRQVGCSQSSVSKCLQGKSSGCKEMSPQTCCRQAGRPEAGETGAQISEVRGNCPAVECWWCACITNNLSQNKGNGWSLSWILSSARSGTEQLDIGLELSSLMSRSSVFRLETQLILS